MKHHAAGRPIGKCKSCTLNGRTACLAPIDPKTEWRRGRCRFQDDADILAQAQNPAPPTGAKAAKLARRERARTTAATPHFNGLVCAPLRMAPVYSLR